MTYELRQGQQGEPLPDGSRCFRLGYTQSEAPEDLIADAAHFALSTEDKGSKLQTLSVYVTALISSQRARELMTGAASKYRIALHLNVDDIRRVHLEVDLAGHPLDVVWDPVAEIEGHAGITGLLQPSGLENANKKYKRLRLRLAQLANVEVIDSE